MKVRAIMTPLSALTPLTRHQKAQEAFDTIEANGFLSLPVLDGQKFVGYLSKQYLYDAFHKSGQADFSLFLDQPVSNFIHETLEPVTADQLIEEAAEIFFKYKQRFVPVVDANGIFEGIVTQNALFGILTKIYGLKYSKVVILTDNFKGTLGRIAEIISKYDGNIMNVVALDTEVLGIQEISIRFDAPDVLKIVNKLQEKGFEVRDYYL